MTTASLTVLTVTEAVSVPPVTFVTILAPCSSLSTTTPVATLIAFAAAFATVFVLSVQGVIEPFAFAGTIVCELGASVAGVSVCVSGAATAP